jgi:hypothetical protein
MKLFIKISMLFMLFVIIVTTFIYNTENVEVTNNDLAKYNWLKPFYNETNLKYLGGYHNIDNGYMELNFRPTTKINFIDFNNFKVIAINH